MTIITKSEAGQKRVMDMDKEEVEAFFAEATKQAQEELHAKGLPYIVGDRYGMYSVYPDGRRVYTPYGGHLVDEGR